MLCLGNGGMWTNLPLGSRAAGVRQVRPEENPISVAGEDLRLVHPPPCTYPADWSKHELGWALKLVRPQPLGLGSVEARGGLGLSFSWRVSAPMASPPP